MNAVWSSGFPYFDFDTDMTPTTPSRAMALEPWSREYFDNVKRFVDSNRGTIINIV